MRVKSITPLAKVIGELFWEISGNNYPFHYPGKFQGNCFAALSGNLNFITGIEFLLPENALNSKSFGRNF